VSQYPPHPMQPPGYGPPPPAQNGMAIAGFILSIVGFFTCCLTSPVGLIMSMVGMKKTDQQGLAIAGLVLGILGTLGLLAILVYVIVVMVLLGGAFFWANEAMATASERARTMGAINTAQSKIQSNAARTNRLPGDAEGTSMIRTHRDAWNNTLKYELEDDFEYQIISAGPDERFGTRDDIKRKFDASLWLSRTDPFQNPGALGVREVFRLCRLPLRARRITFAASTVPLSQARPAAA